MSEGQDKKINYKILTAEEILKEVQVPLKEIEHREEKIEVPVTEKIEKQVEIPPAEEIEERIEVIENEKKENGFLYPEHKENFFYFEPEEKLKPIQETEESQIGERKENLKIKFNLNYVLIPGALIIILLLILFLKPYEKIKALLQSKEKQPQGEIIPTTTQIVFPTTSPTRETATLLNFPTITVSAPAQEITSSITFSTITVSTPTQEIKQVTTEISPINQEKEGVILPTKDLNLPGEVMILQRKDFESFFARQQSFGTKINVKLFENNQKLPVYFLFDYFIKSDNSQELKNELTGNYGFLIYYGNVRKYPILVFEIKDRNKVIKFNQNWEKTTMKNDLQTLFLGFQPPKTNNNFQTKNLNNFSYRILNLDDNYKIIWATINNYLIYTTTETGFKEVFQYLQ